MNYKKYKVLILTFLLVIISFISCKNDTSIVEDTGNTEQSTSAKIALAKLKTHFNNDGSLNTIENPVGNIIFDFGFEFIFPNTLSYNNGTNAIVENFESLVSISSNMTDSLYINGIAFPFQVETFNNGAIEIKTIDNESEFVSLLENRRITGDQDCSCTANYDPVCVEIQNTNNETFTMQFPNFCYAACEGFIQNDIIDCSINDPTNGNISFDGCFSLVYPLSIINDDDDTVVLNNDSDFEYVLFLNTNLNFVYPFDVTLEDGENETVTNENDLINLLINCNFFFACWDNCPSIYNPVCVQFEQNGELITINYQNSCYAECDGFTQTDFVDCTELQTCYDNCPSIDDYVCVEVQLYQLNPGLTVVFQYQNAWLAECAGFAQTDFIDCN